MNSIEEEKQAPINDQQIPDSNEINEIYMDNQSEELSEQNIVEENEGEDDNLSEDPEELLQDLEWEEIEGEEIEGEWNPQSWLPSYTLVPGPSQQFPREVNQIKEIFLLLFDNEILDMLVTQTNRYAEDFFNRFPERKQGQYYKEWENCTIIKLKAYLGILIHTGLSQFPKMVDHWENSVHYSCPFCPNVMTKNQFLLIHKFFHIVDNSRVNTDDRLHKIRPLLDLLTSKFQRFYVLNRELTINERMVKYTGRLSFRQYIPNKPTKLGIKVFLIADSITGYVWNWYVYSGAVVGRRANGVHNLIVDLTQDLHNRGHRLYYDSFFIFVPTVRYLATKGIASAGMLRKNRRLIPDDVKQAPDTLQRGETHFMRVNSLLCFVYRDKRDIRFLTNCHGNQIGENGRPEALINYNIFARGVDKANQSNSFYHFSHRSLKWYKTLFISLLETAISNAYCLYMFQNPNSSLKSLKFRERLASSLYQDYITERNQQSLTRANKR